MRSFKKIISAKEKIRQLEIGKENAYYSALYSGWINTRIESDKSLLTLSVSAIGLLFTILVTINITDYFILILFILSISSFLSSAIIIIKVLDKNADLLQAIANNNDVDKEDKKLQKFDKWKNRIFFIGLLITLILGTTLAIQKMNGGNMSKSKSNNSKVQTTKTPIRKSVQGFQNMKPSGSSNQSSSNSGKSSNKKK